ncbi:hypothetical protein EV664_110116 [Stakelama pacifica]|uniref:Uncharacterized protein n=1 Tax=Stakelama pacifica TaxID=517720 RepID=A0A4R6FG89_9SPHN|nr:hypothetical protein EV664_110116 [Stakelama pacifica]
MGATRLNSKVLLRTHFAGRNVSDTAFWLALRQPGAEAKPKGLAQ